MVNTTDNLRAVRPVESEASLGEEPAPRRMPPEKERVVNTSRVVEEDMEYLDSDEVLHVIPGHPWVATFKDGTELPLVAWAISESDKGHGVAVSYSETGTPRLDVSESVAGLPGFVRYEKRNVNTEEVR
jgi:hypothetical protein